MNGVKNGNAQLLYRSFVTSREGYQNTTDVFTKFHEIKTLDDGAALRFPGNLKWDAKLKEFCEVWQCSCPYMSFKVVPENQTDFVWLHITGPEGTQNFVEGSIKMLTSNINPAPSAKQRLTWKFVRLTNHLRVLPDFLIIGAKKAGTTSLYSYMCQHENVASAYRKETNFFDQFFHYGSNWYRSFFPMKPYMAYAKARGKSLLTGEATPEYLFDPKVPRRVLEVVPDVKLIAILRNPVDRAHSLYQHQLRIGMESAPFGVAANKEIDSLEANSDNSDLSNSYVLGGLYASQLQDWMKVFPREQFLILSNEELSQHPNETLNKVMEFLGLPSFNLKTFRKLNAFPYPDLEPGLREQLVKFFQPHNEALFELIGQRFDWD